MSESKRLLPSEQKGCITPGAVWDHFERGKDNYPICRHCGKSVKNKGGNASNLMAHLKTRHFMVYNSLQKKGNIHPRQCAMRYLLQLPTIYKYMKMRMRQITKTVNIRNLEKNHNLRLSQPWKSRPHSSHPTNERKISPTP